MTVDLNGLNDEQAALRLQGLKGDTIEWCRRVRHE